MYNHSIACLTRDIGVRVEIDVSKPLKRGLRVALGDKVEEITILLCYERLPNFYYCCGCMGHLVRECRDNPSGLGNISKMKFGAWLKAPASSRARSSGGKCSGSKNTSNEGRKEGAENERSSVSTEEVQPVEVAEEVVRGKCGASSLIVGEANPELNSMVEKSVLSMVNPGDEISAVNVVIPRMANIDNPGLSEAFVVQDIAINQEVGSVASSNVTELPSI
ncbi:hypothetical protein ACOSQ3_003307 [Xanthoceras sorbifolium]